MSTINDLMMKVTGYRPDCHVVDVQHMIYILVTIHNSTYISHELGREISIHNFNMCSLQT